MRIIALLALLLELATLIITIWSKYNGNFTRTKTAKTKKVWNNLKSKSKKGIF